MIRNVLSIAGSDPSGGAGIQADLKTFGACGVYGMAAITALTAQNTQGVRGVFPIPGAFVNMQIEEIFADIRVDAVKIGMIATAEIAEAVATVLAAQKSLPVVLDPVMIAKGGAPLLAPDAVRVLRTRLLPLATIVTPNLPEAAALLDEPVARDRATMAAQALRLLDLGPAAALLKGGHLDAGDSPDVLAGPGGLHWFEGARIPTTSTHGTGCTLSSAIAASLAQGFSLESSIDRAKRYLSAAIGASRSLTVGSGHGPLQHFHALAIADDGPLNERPLEHQ